MTTVRVYVNGKGVDVESAGSALDAVRTADPRLATAIEAGERALADSRGLPVKPGMGLYNGAILRVVSNRSRDQSVQGSASEQEVTD